MTTDVLVVNDGGETLVVKNSTDVIVLVQPGATDVVTNESPPLQIVEVKEQVVVSTQDKVTVIESTFAPIVITQLSEGPQGPPGENGADGLDGADGDVGPVGPSGPSGAGTSPPVRVTVPIGATRIIQEFDANVYRTVKWIVTLTNPILGTVRTFELLALNHNTHCSHVIYGAIGNHIHYYSNVQIINNKITLLLTNSDSSDLIVDAIRIGSISI